MSPSPERYTGVILCAGKGSRIDPFNAHYPKPLLPILNRPIMEHQIEHMRALGLRDVVLVVGHLKELVQAHFGDGSRLGVSIRYVEQRETLGIAHAVMQLERHISGPFLLFLGDIFYVPKDLHTMVDAFEAGGVSGVLAVKREDDPTSIHKNFSVSVDDRLRVSRVVEKPRYLVNNLKGCGMYLFAPEIFDAIRQTPRTAMRDEYELTTSIQIFIDSGYWVKAAEVVDWDYNITLPWDLLDCNAKFLAQTGQRNVIDPSSVVHKGAQLDGAIVGERVTITKPVRVSRTIFLPDTRYDGDEDLEDCILSREIKIRCEPPGDRRAYAPR